MSGLRSYNSFDIVWVQKTVCDIAARKPSLYFLMLNTAPFCQNASWRAAGPSATAWPPPNIIHLPPSSDDGYISRFIRSCDAMLHARHMGETFGLAVAEFSAHNRPVITSSVVSSYPGPAGGRMHIALLGSKGLYYDSPKVLARILTSFDRVAAAKRDWNAYHAFAPERVMERFYEVFLQASRACNRHGKVNRSLPSRDWP